jgi:glycosyltransferase involved in cell wall biosynthesis
MPRTFKYPLKLIHLITSLDMGGAEMMLYRLLRHIDRARFENQVICMISPGVVKEKIQALGIPVVSLDMQSGSPSLTALFQLVRLLQRERPAILHTWMYHADLLGALAASVIGTPVIWGIHNWSLDPTLVKSSTVRVVKTNAWLSKWIPKRIIICSDKTRDQHVKFNYAPDKFVTIPNGFDPENFQRDAAARSSFRKDLGLDPDIFLIGLVARFDPLKDHQTFSRAAGLFLQQHPQTHFLLCGKDISWENKKLSMWIEAAGPRTNFHLLGQQDNIPRLMNGLDINTLSSSGEAFPSVIGEAMACEVPCVATDVGDTAYLIGDTGITVPSKDPQQLSRGWERLLEMGTEKRHVLGEQARQRIEQHFSITQIVRRYETLYEKVVNGNKIA